MLDEHESVEAEFVRWPLDFDALEKGHVIDSAKLSQITKCERGTAAYALCTLQVKQEIEKKLAQRDYPVTCKVEKDSIRILTDVEASEYNEIQGEHAVRKAYRALRRQMNVDARNLTEEQQKEHSRRLLHQGMTVSAIRETRRTLRLTAHTNPVRQSLESSAPEATPTT